MKCSLRPITARGGQVSEFRSKPWSGPAAISARRDRSVPLARTIDEFGPDIVDRYVRGQVFPYPEAGGVSNATALFEQFRDFPGIATVVNRARKSSPQRRRAGGQACVESSVRTDTVANYGDIRIRGDE